LRLAIGDDDYQAYTERLGDDRQITPPARTFMLDPGSEYRHRPVSMLRCAPTGDCGERFLTPTSRTAKPGIDARSLIFTRDRREINEQSLRFWWPK
jgi:hypothetical protein